MNGMELSFGNVMEKGKKYNTQSNRLFIDLLIISFLFFYFILLFFCGVYCRKRKRNKLTKKINGITIVSLKCQCAGKLQSIYFGKLLN